MRGPANVPAKKPTAESLGLQTKLTGAEGQFVGFNAKGEAVAQDPLKGTENQYIGFDAEGKQVVKNPLSGGENQYIGFDENGNQVVKELPESGGGESTAAQTVFYGTIGTEWAEDAATGVKYQLVAIEGVLAEHDLGVLDVVMTHEKTTEGHTAFVEEQNQFLDYITNGFAETVDGGITFYIYGEANTVEIPFGLVVI